MRKLITLVILLVCSAWAVNAQQVSGLVNDADAKPVANATVSLLNVKDSSVAKYSVTDKEGRYTFKVVKAGKYILEVSFVGYLKSYSAPFEVGTQPVQLPLQVINKPSADLKGVVVTAKKPMVEVKADKTIVNVENSINAVGNDALELLRKSPGVMVDKDDNISLAGKNGVQVYIDGKPSPLSGKDLSEYLKTLQSNQIESIELITNPSAKYEAAGNAGIINIRLKKNKAFGTNGSLTAGYNIGTYPKYNIGGALNHRDKKVNLFGNYNYNNSKNESFMNLYRTLNDTAFDQHSVFTSNNESHNFKAGMDYYATRFSTFGVMVNGNFNTNDTKTNSNTYITYIPTNLYVKKVLANNEIEGTRKNVNPNLNYRFADTSGHELNIDADYGWYRIRSNQLQPNITLSPMDVLLDKRIYNMQAPADINIYSLKGDYEQNFKKGRLGFGFKTSYTNSDNDFQRFNVYDNGKFKDTLRSNKFDYKENINAAYVNYNRQFKGIMVQLGLRAENTNAKGYSNGFKTGSDGLLHPYDSTFTRNYTDLFPSAAVTFNKNIKSQWTVTYSRRIDRPAYQDLNPFEFQLDQYTYQKGNTGLTPQYTNSIGVTHMYKFFLTTSLNYSHVSDVFAQVVDTSGKNRSYITKQNLAKQDVVSLNISAPVQIKWYNGFFNVNSNYSHYSANLNGRPIDVDAFNVNLYAQNSFKLSKTMTGEISGFYTSPSIWQGTFKSKAMWSMDAGLQKTIMKGKANIKASVSDIFLTMRWGATSNFSGQYINANGGWESRLFKLNFTYRFGNNQVKAARQRKTAADDEGKRVGSQGGGLGGN